MLKIAHDLHFLKIALRVDLVSKLFLLQRNGLDGVDLTIPAAPSLAHNTESATP